MAGAVSEAYGCGYQEGHRRVRQALRWAREDDAYRQAMDARRKLLEAAVVATLDAMAASISIYEIDAVINQRRVERGV